MMSEIALTHQIYYSVFAFSASVFEIKMGIFVEAILSDGLVALELDHLGALDVCIDMPENVEAFRSCMCMAKGFRINHESLGEELEQFLELIRLLE